MTKMKMMKLKTLFIIVLAAFVSGCGLFGKKGSKDVSRTTGWAFNSEETGNISIALDGKITRPMEPQGLKKMLTHLYQPKTISEFGFWPTEDEKK